MLRKTEQNSTISDIVLIELVKRVLDEVSERSINDTAHLKI